MIRVGIAIPFDGQAWLGGLNYFRNLVRAIGTIERGRIQPVLIVGTNQRDPIRAVFPDVELIGTRLLDARHPYRLIRRAWQRTFDSDPLLEAFLARHGIHVLSHSGVLAHESRIVTVSWIPDFQHRHYPSLFSKRELANRDRGLMELFRCSDTVLVSSQHARNDALMFYPTGEPRLRVLPFVSDPTPYLDKCELALLQSKYRFNGPYFLLPNQFWAHKNHRLVMDALALAQSEVPDMQVLCTGNSSDARQPQHFPGLMNHANKLGLLETFKCLGIVPYEDLVELMRNACAVINPSLFEGWSTSVEEAKSLGKQILVSRIPVHIEQMPTRGVFFDPYDAAELAHAMTQVYRTWDPRVERQAEEMARAQLPERQRDFGQHYQEIIIESLARRGYCTPAG